MMEDAGEDVLRQRPSMVVAFFNRIGQVCEIIIDNWVKSLDFIMFYF